MKRVIFIAALLLLLLNKGVIANNISCRFTSFLIAGDMKSWAVLTDSLQKVKLSKADDDVLLYAQYALTGYYFSQDMKKEAAATMTIFEAHLSKAMEKYPSTANYHAFKAALYGFKIALSPWKAPVYSFYHQREVDRAMKLRKGEALPLIEQANSYYFRPSFVGGNKTKALQYYEQAFNILKRSPQCNWVFFNNGAWLGQVYTKLGNPIKAKETYGLLLSQNPGFQYVRDELLPQLERGEFIDVGGRFEEMLMKEKPTY
jgi:tetratricopeptide (TPR) repeat protein